MTRVEPSLGLDPSKWMGPPGNFGVFGRLERSLSINSWDDWEDGRDGEDKKPGYVRGFLANRYALILCTSFMLVDGVLACLAAGMIDGIEGISASRLAQPGNEDNWPELERIEAMPGCLVE